LSFTEKSEEASETQEDSRQTGAARPETFAARVFGVRWSVLAGVCVLVAAVCLLAGRMDAAFVVATLGVVAWFLDQRNLLRARSIEADTAEDDFASEEDEQ
jgi:hypothetical protein